MHAVPLLYCPRRSVQTGSNRLSGITGFFKAKFCFLSSASRSVEDVFLIISLSRSIFRLDGNSPAYCRIMLITSVGRDDGAFFFSLFRLDGNSPAYCRIIPSRPGSLLGDLSRKRFIIERWSSLISVAIKCIFIPAIMVCL